MRGRTHFYFLLFRPFESEIDVFFSLGLDRLFPQAYIVLKSQGLFPLGTGADSSGGYAQIIETDCFEADWRIESPRALKEHRAP